MYYTYILECKDKTLYTGYTADVEARLVRHNAGTGAKYTRARRPCKLVYYEQTLHKKIALEREREIKKLTRRQKLNLIKEYS